MNYVLSKQNMNMVPRLSVNLSGNLVCFSVSGRNSCILVIFDLHCLDINPILVWSDCVFLFLSENITVNEKVSKPCFQKLLSWRNYWIQQSWVFWLISDFNSCFFPLPIILKTCIPIIIYYSHAIPSVSILRLTLLSHLTKSLQPTTEII